MLGELSPGITVKILGKKNRPASIIVYGYYAARFVALVENAPTAG